LCKGAHKQFKQIIDILCFAVNRVAARFSCHA